MTTATLYDTDFYAWTQTQVESAWAETALDKEIFPAVCPYTLQQLLDDNFFPQA